MWTTIPLWVFLNSKFTYLANVLFLFNWHNGALKITNADYCEIIHTAWEKLWFSTNEMQPNGFYRVSRAICAWRNLSGLVFPNVYNGLSVTQNWFECKSKAFTLCLFNGCCITDRFKSLTGSDIALVNCRYTRIESFIVFSVLPLLLKI